MNTMHVYNAWQVIRLTIIVLTISFILMPQAVYSQNNPDTLSVSPVNVTSGENITATWNIQPGTDVNWIGLYKAGDPPDTQHLLRPSWIYIKGNSGNVPFAIFKHIGPGYYVLHLFRGNSGHNLRTTSNVFTVGKPTAPSPVASTPPKVEPQVASTPPKVEPPVAAASTAGTATGNKLPPCPWNIVVIEPEKPAFGALVLDLKKDRFDYGSRIVVNWHGNVNINPRTWIGLFRAGEPPISKNLLRPFWKWAADTKSDGIEFWAPSNPATFGEGTVFAFYAFREDWNFIGSSYPFTLGKGALVKIPKDPCYDYNKMLNPRPTN